MSGQQQPAPKPAEQPVGLLIFTSAEDVLQNGTPVTRVAIYPRLEGVGFESLG
jgi:hypothetical protein